VKKPYNDDALNLAGASEKVKQLIDEHLFSLGINSKIPPGKLLSPNCLAEVEKNETSKANASEIEHAIRKYSHVHFDQAPTFYTKLSDKLEVLIRRYKDDDHSIVHKLVHLLHANHTAAFWNAVDEVLPDYCECKAWRRGNGVGRVCRAHSAFG